MAGITNLGVALYGMLAQADQPAERLSDLVITLTLIGAAAFGLVVGWVTYRTLRRIKESGLSDIATVIGAVGGAAVTALFPQETGAFGVYCIGLALGFFGYAIVAWRKGVPDILGSPDAMTTTTRSGGNLPPDRV